MCSCPKHCECVEGAEKVHLRRLKFNGNIHDEEAEEYESENAEEHEDFDNRSVGMVDSSDEEEEETGDDVMDSSDDKGSDIAKPLALVDLDYHLDKCSESSFSSHSKFGMSFAGPQGPSEIYHPSLTKTGRGPERDEDGTGHAPESTPCTVGEEVVKRVKDWIAILERRWFRNRRALWCPELSTSGTAVRMLDLGWRR